MNNNKMVEIEFFIVISDDERNSGTHTNMGESYFVCSFRDYSLYKGKAESLAEWLKTGCVEIPTTPTHVEKVYGKLYQKVTTITEVIC